MTRGRTSKVASLIRGIGAVALSPRRWGPFEETWRTTQFDHAFACSFSQAGEDLCLFALLHNCPSKTYLDVGAHHPSRFSVTRLLYDRGWNGVNVEANHDLLAAFVSSRPRDRNVWATVGTTGAVKEFAVFHEAAVSTADVEWRRRFESEGLRVKEVRQAVSIGLSHLCERFLGDRPIGLLNIDCEGSDLEILQSGDWRRFRPLWVSIEGSPPVSAAESCAAGEFMHSVGYQLWCVLPNIYIFKRVTEQQAPNSDLEAR